MIKPEEFATELPYGPWSCRGCDVWDTLCAAIDNDVDALRRLLQRESNLSRYHQPIHFAVREGHIEAVRLLLDSGADPDAKFNGDDPVTVARDRGNEEVARLLEDVRSRRGRAAAADSDHPIHIAASAGDLDRVRELLDAEPTLVHSSDRAGSTPLHRAVAASAQDVVCLLLDRGADIHARHGDGRRNEFGYPAVDFQPIDTALWKGPFWDVRGDTAMARLLVSRGATYDLVIAAALGDLDRVRDLLGEDPARIAEARPSGKRALSSAVQFGHVEIVRLLLDRGADPNWSDGANAPRGLSLHVAARAGDRQTVETLLAAGADPNSYLDSAGNATYVARTAELRALLLAHGGFLDTYDLVWLGEDDEVVRRVSEDPRSANAGCGGALAAAATQGKRELLIRLLDAGARVAPVVNDCRSYLFTDPEMLRLLLASGMDPDLPNWLLTTPLHDLCSRDSRGRPREHRAECAKILLDAGANISAKDEDYRSTPLAWAARNDLADMVELLLLPRRSHQPP